jgi:hypothetical protein
MTTARLATQSRVAAVALLVSCAGAPGGAPGADQPTVVQFSYRAVNPHTARIPSAGNVNWVNIAPDTRGFVVFTASIASSFRCKDLQPIFSKTPEGYQSLPITGMQSERVQLPCALAPGSYDYEIWLTGSGFEKESTGTRPAQILRAKIVVE